MAFETVQYATGCGASDITDVITNTAGGLVGVAIAAGVTWKLGRRAERVTVITLAAVLVATAIGIALWLKISGIHFRL